MPVVTEANDFSSKWISEWRFGGNGKGKQDFSSISGMGSCF